MFFSRKCARLTLAFLLLTIGLACGISIDGSQGNEVGDKPQNTAVVDNNNPRIWNFAACVDPCLEDISNAQDTFPENPEKVYFRFNYENFPTDVNVIRRWSMGGEEWVRYECVWDAPSSGVFETALRHSNGLKSGQWDFEVWVDGVLLLTKTITIEGDYDFWEPVGVIEGQCK